MKRLRMAGVGLALAWLTVGTAVGQPLPATERPAPFQVSLGRPELLDEAPVTRVSFHHPAPPVLRTQSPEPFFADAVRSRPMPVGPAETGFAAGSGSTSRSSTFATEAEAPEASSPLAGSSQRVIASSGPVTSSALGACGDDCCGSPACGDCCEPRCQKLWGCCKLCSHCCPLDPHRFYFSAEYLLWWIKEGNTPPLATTGPFVEGNELGSSGIIGQPGTVVLFQDLDYDVFSGGRFTLGWWTDPCCQSCGFEVSGFFLGERSVNASASSFAFPVLARPFFNGNDGIEFSEVTARPDLSTGSIFIHAPSQLWGVEGNVRCNLCCGCASRWDLLAGVRYLDLKESLTIVENLTVTADNTTFPSGTQVVVVDHFATHNQFTGGQIGLAGQYRWNRWSLDLRAKLALGVTHQTVDIFGAQYVRQPGGGVQAFPGGLLALPNSNIGHYSRDKFTVVPEFGVNLGYDIAPHLRAFVGYTFLYWSSVQRPGDQIDRVVNINRIPNFITSPNPGPNRPIFPNKGTDFWAQGVNFGLEYRY